MRYDAIYIYTHVCTSYVCMHSYVYNINIHIYVFFIEHACAYVHWRFVHSRVDRPTDRRPRSLAFSPSISRSRILSLFSARAVAPVRELSQFFCFYSLLGSYVYCCRVGVGVGVGVFSFRILFILGAFSFSFRFPRFYSSLIHVRPSETRATAYTERDVGRSGSRCTLMIERQWASSTHTNAFL